MKQKCSSRVCCRDSVLELTEQDLQRMGIPVLSTGSGRRLADAIFAARKLRSAQPQPPECPTAAAASKKLEPDYSPEKQCADKPKPKRSPSPAAARPTLDTVGETPSAQPLSTSGEADSNAPSPAAAALEPRFYMECSVCMERNVSDF